MEPHETVLSDIHLQSSNTTHHSSSRHSEVTSTIEFVTDSSHAKDGESVAAVVDSDGDILVPRKRGKVQRIILNHCLETTLDRVGLQVWQGCLLLCEYILANKNEFRDEVALELGSGAALCSILVATTVPTVFCTDIGNDILEMAQVNVEQNLHLLRGSNNEAGRRFGVRVRRLDWMEENNLTTDGKFGWSEEDSTLLHKKCSLLLAADVIYDIDLTAAFFRRLHKIMSIQPTKRLYISLEKRLNFTMTDLEESCPAYEHFKECLQLLLLENCPNFRYSVEQIAITFPQCFLHFDRSPQMELWKITCHHPSI